MSDKLVTIGISILTSSAVTAILNWIFKLQVINNQRRWEIKREACLEALEIIDYRFADYDWKAENGDSIKVDENGFKSTADIRSCFNKLILACKKNSNVPELFEKCLHLIVDGKDPEPLPLANIKLLRNAIRKELGFGNKLQTNVFWIFSINRKNKDKK